MNKGVSFTGFLKYQFYPDKIQFMDTPIFKLDMKFYNQEGNVKFLDADFANVLMVKSNEFDNKSFQRACDTINMSLKAAGFNGHDLFKIGSLKSMPDFDLGSF